MMRTNHSGYPVPHPNLWIWLMFFGWGISAQSGEAWSDAAVLGDGREKVQVEAGLRHASGPVLRWMASAGESLTIQPASVAGAKGLDFFIFYGESAPSKLELEAQSEDGDPVLRLELFPNGKGWRRVTGVFGEDGVASLTGMKKAPYRIRLTILQGNPCAIWLGKPAWLKSPPFRRTADPHCPGIYALKDEPYQHSTKDWLLVYRQPPVPGKETVTPDLEKVGERYDRWALGDGKDTSPLGVAIASAQAEWIKNAKKDLVALGLRREGPFIASLEKKGKPLSDVAALLAPLAMEYRRNPDGAKIADIVLVLDFLEQEGFGNAPDPVGESTMQFARLKLAPFAHGAALLREPLVGTGRLDWVRRTLRWYSRAGEWDGKTVLEVNSDVLRGESAARFAYAITAPDAANRAFELGRLSRWLTACLTVSSNQLGLIKPDSTVYHHRAPYLVEYGPHALMASSAIALWLHGGPWSIPDATRERLELCGDALLDISRGFSVPIGTRGRFPGGNRTLPVNLPLYLTLSSKPCFSGRHAQSVREIMEALGDAEARTLLAKASTYLKFLWMGSAGMAEQAAASFAAPPRRRETAGFQAFNWAQVSVARAPGWAAQVQGYSRWVFDFETGNYPAIENDWGRYVRYGAMELASGDKLHDPLTSGWTLEQGWDWSLIPGATTLQIPWKDLGIPAPPGKRVMRNFSDSKFCAGLAARDGFGVFGFELHDLSFPGDLEARKTVFVAGDAMVCLGSRIRSSLADTPAVTTLFQFGLPAGTTAPAPGETTLEKRPEGDPSMRLVDPAGNAFTFLEGKLLKRRQGEQTGPTAGGKITSGAYDTAWIDHGAQPECEGYAYRIEPKVQGRTARRPAYRILERSDAVHAVKFPESRRMGYAVFEPLSKPVGELLQVDRPCLIWTEEDKPGSLLLDVCDPDLNYPAAAEADEASDAGSQPTRVTLTLSGRWMVVSGSASVTVRGQETTVVVTCAAGEPARVVLAVKS